MDRWLRDYRRPRETTNRTNAAKLKAFRRDFARRRLDDIDRPEARAWALEHRSALDAVRAMFTDAVNDGLARSNPFAGLRLPGSRGRNDLEVLGEAEVQALAETALHVSTHGPTIRTMIIFAAFCGVRRGELFALEWGDLDLRDLEIHVRRRVDSHGAIDLPKNGRTRKIVLPPPARDALVAMPRRAGTEIVFTTPSGRGFTQTSWTYHWHPVRAAAGRPAMDFYELRHFCATHLLERGLTPSDVAVQLGHTDGGRLVQELYGHPSEDAARERVKRAFEANVRQLRSVDDSVASR